MIINPFYRDFIKDETETVLVMGGTGTGKSYAVAQKIILRMVEEIGHTFLVVHRNFKNHRNTTYQTLLEVIRSIDLQDEFLCTTTPMEITFNRNGNKILFVGLDDSDKVRSLNVTGIWIEEATDIDSKKDFFKVQDRLRGKTKNYKQTVLSFNPDSSMHWIKTHFYDNEIAKVSKYKSTYNDNIFLTQDDKDRLERYKDFDPVHYQVYTLGEWGQLSDQKIYTNYEVTSEIPLLYEQYDTMISGVDFGFNAPSALVLLGVDADKNLYVLKEIHKKKLTTVDFIDEIKQTIDYKYISIVADSADPGAIETMKRNGLKVIPASKPKGSVKNGIDFIKSRKIFIHPDCTYFIKEIQNYSWQIQTNTDYILDEPIKINDHLMDAIRYACQLIQVDRKLKAGLRIY